ncbi:hypothetical protein VARIO8X_150109 [Burkholderiales bacterium 8X]|nr:hypothetical protein VARIO8X_150109 [Burkholderiales bacterium 8X]
MVPGAAFPRRCVSSDHKLVIHRDRRMVAELHRFADVFAARKLGNCRRRKVAISATKTADVRARGRFRLKADPRPRALNDSCLREQPLS